MRTMYFTKIGKSLYFDLLSKINHREILSRFFQQVYIVENNFFHENNSYGRILIELMIIAEKEEIAFLQESLVPIMDVWSDVFTQISLDYRFSGAKWLSSNEILQIKEFMKILEDSDFQKSAFMIFLRTELSMASYRIVQSEIPVVHSQNYLLDTGIRPWLTKLFPKGFSLAK